MTISELLGRQYGKTRNFSLDHIVEKFQCSRVDVHALEGQDLDLIPPFSCQFSTVNPHIVAVADEDGGIAILDTLQAGIQAVQQSWRAHENAIFDLEWVPGDNKLVTASGDQKLILWDVDTEEPLMTCRGHNSSVRTVKHRDKFVFASGARDGHVMIWDSRTKSKDGCMGPVNTIKNAHAFDQLPGSGKKRRSLRSNQDSQQSVTTVIFQDDYTLLSSGSVDGSIKVWDLRKSYSVIKNEAVPKHKFMYGGSSIRLHGFSHMVLDSTRTRLFASCMDNVVYMYNSSNFSTRPVKAYKGHKTSSFYIRLSLSPDDLYLLSGSSDSDGYIWNVNNHRSSPMVLKSHTGEVSGVSWCPTDFSKLVTLGDDCTVRIWRLHPGKVHPSVKLDQEIIAGTCEKTHKEKGINAQSQTSPLNSPKSPHKGAMIAPSPMSALSPSVHSSLLHLPSSSPMSPMMASPRLVSPSITRWFRTALSSPPGQSPRKLEVVFSPRKSGTPGKSPMPTEAAVICQRTGTPRRGQKRKLAYDEADSDINSKKRIVNDENFNVPRNTPVPISPARNGLEGRVLRNHTNKANTPCQKKLEFGVSAAVVDNDDCAEFLSTPTKFSSPTVNLPNYVLDPKPRTPRAKAAADSNKEVEVDWLTQIRIDLAAETPEKTLRISSHQPSPKTRLSVLTESGRKLRSSPSSRAERSSPRLARTPTQGRKISHYFSASPASRSSLGTPSKHSTSPTKKVSSPAVKESQSTKKTDSPLTKKTESPMKKKTDSPMKKKTDSPLKKKTDSPLKKLTDSPLKKTDSPLTNRTCSPTKKSDLAGRRNESPSKTRNSSPLKRKTESPSKRFEGSPMNRLAPAKYPSSPLAKKS